MLVILWKVVRHLVRRDVGAGPAYGHHPAAKPNAIMTWISFLEDSDLNNHYILYCIGSYYVRCLIMPVQLDRVYKRHYYRSIGEGWGQLSAQPSHLEVRHWGSEVYGKLRLYWFLLCGENRLRNRQIALKLYECDTSHEQTW